MAPRQRRSPPASATADDLDSANATPSEAAGTQPSTSPTGQTTNGSETNTANGPGTDAVLYRRRRVRTVRTETSTAYPDGRRVSEASTESTEFEQRWPVPYQGPASAYPPSVG